MPNNSQRTTTHEREISYQFRMNRDDWRDWTDTLPRNIPIHERLAALIKTDELNQRHNHDITTDTPTTIRVNQGHELTLDLSLPIQELTAWEDTIPTEPETRRDKQLAERLERLLKVDAAFNMEGIDASKAALLEMKSERLERLSSQAQNALTERENPEQALEKLSKIEEIADSIHIKHTDD